MIYIKLFLNMYLSKLIFYIFGRLISKVPLIEKILKNYNNNFRIVYYHMVTDVKHDYYFGNKSINKKEFYNHMIFLKQRYEVISLKEALYKIKHKKTLDNKLVITFDDGFKENYSTIAPILDEMKIPATFFFTSNLLKFQSDVKMFWQQPQKSKSLIIMKE